MTRPLQRTPEWYAERREGVTSTDVAAILGISPYQSEGDVAREKMTGTPSDDELDAATARRFRLGRNLEAAVAAEDEVEHGFQLRRVRRLVRSKQYPWALASLDYERRGERTIVETKTSASRRWDDQLPLDVEAQVRWQMGVARYPRAHVAALRFGVELVCHDVYHDQATFDNLVIVASDFRERLAQGGPFSETRASARRAWPVDDGTEIMSDPQVEEAVADLLRVRRDLRVLGDREDALVAAVETRMGPATVMTGLGWKITWRRTADRTETNWREALEDYLAEQPDELGTLVAKHTETKAGSRRFVLREEKDF